MKILLFAAILAVSGLATAKTTYFIKGKSMSAAEATKAVFTNPRVKVLKVQANWVTLKESTMRFNKASDATISDIPRSK